MQERASTRSIVYFSLACVVCFLIVFINICIIDDAYISFRVVDNALNGYGLRWNIDERVQAYTHPLWLLLHIPFYPLFGNIYWETITLSLACGMVTLWLLMRLAGPLPLMWKFAIIILPLTLSRVFRNYVVCGLENPLSFMLFAWMMVELFDTRRTYNYYRFSFIASLAAITRFDNVLLILPLWAGLTWMHRQHLSLPKFALAISPLLLWHGFSLFYYGFVFPNTKYAKLHMGIDTSQYLQQGMYYFLNFPTNDPLAFLCITVGGFLMLSRLRMRGEAGLCLFLLGIGFLVHAAYVLSVGGDFMPGRFFANMLVIAMAVLILHLAHTKRGRQWFLAGVVVLAPIDWFVLQPRLPDRANETLNHGIDDQHDYYYQVNGMLSDKVRFFRREPNDSIVGNVQKLRERIGDETRVYATTINGMRFYYGGPNMIILDMVGLGDALMARLPTADRVNWRIGHPVRDLPTGYLHARKTGDFSQMDPSLARYYEKLRLVTSGELMDTQRLKTIAGFQLGLYDHWLQDYMGRYEPLPSSRAH